MDALALAAGQTARMDALLDAIDRVSATDEGSHDDGKRGTGMGDDQRAARAKHVPFAPIVPSQQQQQATTTTLPEQMRTMAAERARPLFQDAWRRSYQERGGPAPRPPTLARRQVDLFDLYVKVHSLGGYRAVRRRRQWAMLHRSMTGRSRPATDGSSRLAGIYRTFLMHLDGTADE
ncbi:ARID/BRIGHT DNA binding domain containing protein [Plasmodiophora brassicae]